MIRTVFAFAMGVGFLITGVSGCATSPEPGITASFSGLQAKVKGRPEQVVKATRQVFEEMDLVVTKAEATRLQGEVIARSSNDRRVMATLENVGTGTHVQLSGAGRMWEETGLGVSILERIDKRMAQRVGGQGQNGQGQGDQAQNGQTDQQETGQQQDTGGQGRQDRMEASGQNEMGAAGSEEQSPTDENGRMGGMDSQETDRPTDSMNDSTGSMMDGQAEEPGEEPGQQPGDARFK